MKRRSLLVGVGAIAGSGSLAIGSGAFTSVSAERSVSIEVAKDFNAFLSLEPNTVNGLNDESTSRSSTDGNVVYFEIPGDGSGENQDADGVGTDSVYEFHDLLKIVNNGTQPVTVQSEYAGGVLEDLALVRKDGRLSENPPTIGVGDSIDVGLYIDTHGTDIGEYDETLTIVAERVGGNRD